MQQCVEAFVAWGKFSELPTREGDKILSVELEKEFELGRDGVVRQRREQVVVWYLTDLDKPLRSKRVLIVDTGECIGYDKCVYLGTLRVSQGERTIHLFEIPEGANAIQ